MIETNRVPECIIVGKLPAGTQIHIDHVDAHKRIMVDNFESLSGITTDQLKVIIISENVSKDSIEQYLPSVREANPSLSVLGIVSKPKKKNDELNNWVDQLFILPNEESALLAELRHLLINSSPIYYVLSHGIKKSSRFIFSIAVLVFIWEIIVRIFDLPQYLLPTPGNVFRSFLEQSQTFLMHMGITAYEALAGFIIGNGLGISSAIILHRFQRLQEFTMPVFISLQAIPIVALAPLLIVWLGTGLISKIAMASIICFFPMVVNTLQAFSNIDRDFQELFRFHRAGYLQTLKLLLIPASFPAILSALRISAGLSVVGAIVAELTGANKGLGYLLLNASYRLETDKMFVAMLLSAVLGMIFYQLTTSLRFVVPRSWCIERNK